ncbi:unnamed protein product [Adineta steineri]|uniref:Uncharacterized protein n=1 Tax=Adineta steineri TaxID=433720 RepID=A0A815PYP4_9BILA|nr:unnamed protein product [Adineta steineri]CAF1455098.1 unnamed protein product [Adineta steineri]CAF1568792.1 unnamed protein product [Adineta steineri]
MEENLKSVLPKLLDSILDNSHFVNDHLAVRLIKLLSKYFTDSWQQIISNKEPLSPRPAIQITTDQFIIFLDYEVISETSSIDQALCIVISLYVIFELQFGNSQDQTTATYIGDKDLINEYSSESSDSSSSSLSPMDPPLVIHISPTKEQQRQIASSSSSNGNTLCEVNIKQQVSAASTDRSSTISNKKTCQAKKRLASSEEPIALRVKRTRVKRQIN